MNSTVFKVLTKKDIFACKRAKNGIVISDSEEHFFFFGEKDFKDIYDPDPFDGDTSQKTEHFKDYCGSTTGGEVSSANDG